MKEKFIQINKIEGYEEIREWYWISNSDIDKIINRNTGKMMKFWINKNGYKMVSLRAKDGKQKNCYLHVIKAKAFLFGPNPSGTNVVRHLNDCKTDNCLENLAFGTQSDNNLDCIRNGNYNYEAATKNLIKNAAKNGKINGAKTGAKNGIKGGVITAKKYSKPVKCIETGTTYTSAREASRQTKIPLSSISYCCSGKRKTAKGLHWEFVNKEVK